MKYLILVLSLVSSGAFADVRIGGYIENRNNFVEFDNYSQSIGIHLKLGDDARVGYGFGTKGVFTFVDLDYIELKGGLDFDKEFDFKLSYVYKDADIKVKLSSDKSLTFYYVF